MAVIASLDPLQLIASADRVHRVHTDYEISNLQWHAEDKGPPLPSIIKEAH